MFNGTKEQFIIDRVESMLNKHRVITQDDYDNILIEAEEEFIDIN